MNLKSKKGITGADIAVAVTVIVMTIGIVTMIYVNTINHSKDNVRYANAVRIATNIIENIQKQPYEYVIHNVGVNVTEQNKLFDTKIPNGFFATVSLGNAPVPDIARDITVEVKYKGNSSYKTITLMTVKEREMMDMTNSPDISLISGYNPLNNSQYYYPVKYDSSQNKFVVTTTSDIDWYDYEDGRMALILKTNNGNKNVNEEVEAAQYQDIYAWIPRYVSDGTNIQYIYGSSNYPIVLNDYTINTNKTLFTYGIALNAENIPQEFDFNVFHYQKEVGATTFNTGFAENDGLSGFWMNRNDDPNGVNVNSAKFLINAIISNNSNTSTMVEKYKTIFDILN